MVAKHVDAEIVVTPSNDPRSYRVNSDRLLATGFRPKKTVEDAINEMIGMYSQGRAEERGPLVQSEMDGTRGGQVSAQPLPSPSSLFSDYSERLTATLRDFDWAPVERLAHELLDCWRTGRQVFLAGNGGSGGNANHLANDFLYPLSKTSGSGLRVHVAVRQSGCPHLPRQ